MKALLVVTFYARSVTAGGGGSEMGQSKDGKASDLASVFETTEHGESTTGTEENVPASGMLFMHIHLATYIRITLEIQRVLSTLKCYTVRTWHPDTHIYA